MAGKVGRLLRSVVNVGKSGIFLGIVSATGLVTLLIERVKFKIFPFKTLWITDRGIVVVDKDDKI